MRQTLWLLALLILLVPAVDAKRVDGASVRHDHDDAARERGDAARDSGKGNEQKADKDAGSKAKGGDGGEHPDRLETDPRRGSGNDAKDDLPGRDLRKARDPSATTADVSAPTSADPSLAATDATPLPPASASTHETTHEAPDAREAPEAEPHEDEAETDAAPTTHVAWSASGAVPDEPTWGRAGSLLNSTRDPSQTAAPSIAQKVATGGGPWVIWGLGAVFGVGLGLGAGYRLVRGTNTKLDGSPADPTQEPRSPTTLPALMDYVAKVPQDAQACFRLAILMLKAGLEMDGLRYLDRSFRLDPTYVLQLLRDEEYEPVRQQSGVRQLLLRLKRDQDRRAWSGYA